MNEYRQSIDAINREMAELFEKRMDAVKEIAREKQKNGIPIRDEQRERDILSSCQSAVKDEVKPYWETVMKTLLAVSCEYQESLIAKGENDGASDL